MEKKEGRFLSFSLGLLFIVGVLFLGTILSIGNPSFGVVDKATAAVAISPTTIPQITQGTSTTTVPSTIAVIEESATGGPTQAFGNTQSVSARDLWLQITPTVSGVTFANAPNATTTAAGTTTANIRTSGTPTLSTGGTLIRVPLTEATTPTPTTLTSTVNVSNIRFNVATSTAAGTVTVALFSSDSTPTATTPQFSGSPITVLRIVATTTPPPPVTTTGTVTGPARLPKVVQGFTSQTAGNLTISETTITTGVSGSLDSRDLWLRIAQLSTATARGVSFTSVPDVTRTAGGGITLGTPSIVSGMVRIPLSETTVTTRAITSFAVTNIRYDVATSTAVGTVTVEVLASETTPTTTTTVFGSAANARVVPGSATLFPDIIAGQPGFFAAPAISFLKARGAISGFPDGLFRPQNNVTRAEFTKMMVITRGLTLVATGTPSFPDVPNSHWAARYIATARAAGLVNGYPDGTFKPNSNITRAEIATIIVRGSGVAINTSGTQFSDVPSTHWAFNFIMTARNNDFVAGFPDNTFRPNNLATRAESAQFIFNWDD